MPGIEIRKNFGELVIRHSGAIDLTSDTGVENRTEIKIAAQNGKSSGQADHRFAFASGWRRVHWFFRFWQKGTGWEEAGLELMPPLKSIRNLAPDPQSLG